MRERWGVSRVVVLALGLACSFLPRAGFGESGAGGEKQEWDFDSDQPGRIARGFRSELGTWRVVRQGKSHVLAQEAKSEDAAYNLVLVEDTHYKDVDVQVKMRDLAGDVDRGGGLVWRVKDPRNYYLARFNPLEDNFRLYRVEDGVRTQLRSAKVPLGAGWHTLRVIMVGDAVDCYLDGVRWLEAHDAKYPDGGGIGLWTKADARSEFDDLIAARAVQIALPAPGNRNEKAEEPAEPTKEFAVRGERAYLGGHEIDLWGLRSGNALYSEAVTERHITNLDNMAAHGINCLGVYIQGANAGWPDPEAGLDGFRRNGKLKPEVADRLERLVRAADRRGMVVMVGILSPRKDQDLYDEACIRRAIEETGRFLVRRQLRNVFVDIMHEFDQQQRIDHALLREPDGAEKKVKLTKWFKDVAPNIEAGICPTARSDTADTYPGMDVRIIQKEMAIPSEGFVVNVETERLDVYENDGVFNPGARAAAEAIFRSYLEAPNAVMLFHAAFIQGLGNASRSAPHAEMGGYGTSIYDRGIRFYYEWVRDHVGRWEYPQHVKGPR